MIKVVLPTFNGFSTN